MKFISFSALAVGHVTKACDILRSVEDFKHKQGMVCDKICNVKYSDSLLC